MQRMRDRRPGVPARLDVGQQVGDGSGWCYVVPGALVEAQLPGAALPVQQSRQGLPELLGREGIDDALVDEAEVDEQLAEAPALQLALLRLDGFGEPLRTEHTARVEVAAEIRRLAGSLYGVDAAGAQIHPRRLATGGAQVKATAGAAVRQQGQHLGEPRSSEVALEHAAPPLVVLECVPRHIDVPLVEHRQAGR